MFAEAVVGNSRFCNPQTAWMWSQAQMPIPWIWFPGPQNPAPNSTWLLDSQHGQCNCKNAQRHPGCHFYRLLHYVHHYLVMVLKCVREVASGLEQQGDVEGCHMSPGYNAQLDVWVSVVDNSSTCVVLWWLVWGMTASLVSSLLYFLFVYGDKKMRSGEQVDRTPILLALQSPRITFTWPCILITQDTDKTRTW